MASKVEEVWKEITMNIPSTISDAWWTVVAEKYSSDKRKYHNIGHLQEKFNHLESVKPILKNSNAVAFAIFFHYFEYDPKASDNEQKSIEQFKKFSSEGGIEEESELHKEVISLIESAVSHCTDEHKTNDMYGKEDVHYFLDMDMVVLGSAPEEYLEYSKKIREEYDFLPDNIYKSLRMKVLQSFLLIPNIFSTKEFREKFENQAKENILKEIESLK